MGEYKNAKCPKNGGIIFATFFHSNINLSFNLKVCEGDAIEVEVGNHMVNGEGTSIHWHGLHQEGQAYMDGVAMITQCPILPLNSFNYRWVRCCSTHHVSTYFDEIVPLIFTP